jgi:PAS domain S-box-containing protein
VTSSPAPSRTRFGRLFVWSALFAAIAITALLAYLTLEVNREFGRTQTMRADVIHSYETRAELERLLSLHKDLETGQRGYNLTGNEQFLAPYVEANRQIDASLDRLATRWRNDPGHRADLAELRRLSGLKREFAERTIAATQEGNDALTLELVMAGTGLRLMGEIRRAVARIDRDEREQLEHRAQVAERARARLQARIVMLEVLLTAVLIVVLILLARAYFGLERSFRRERNLAARQEAIFDSALDGMIVINASGSVETINPAAAQMFGYAAEELVRRDVGMLFEVAPDRGEVETFLKRLAARKGTAADDVQDFTARRKDGSLFPTAVSVSPVYLVDGVRFLAILRDVTERLAVNRMKSEFVSTVSHELRTPLTSISGSLGLIAGGAAGALPERAQRLIEIAQSNCARLIRLINDILDIERIESGKVHFDVRPLALSPLLAQTIEANRDAAAERGIAFELGAVPPGAAVLGDEDRLIQVFTNLLSNAAKFSPEGGSVRVTVSPLDRRFRISVADEGPGIPEEFRERIFGKFAQADSSDTRTKGGTGLGLSIVREIVERLGGAVGFDSVPGEGATFHVDLPAAPASVDAGREVEQLGRISDSDIPMVLHVDDDPDMLRIVADAFEGRAEVHSTASLVEARAAIPRYVFDAVVLDIAMADGDGLDLIPLIRKRQRDAAIIVFTAQDAEPSRLEGVDLVLVKSRDSLGRLVGDVERLAGRPREEDL